MPLDRHKEHMGNSCLSGRSSSLSVEDEAIDSFIETLLRDKKVNCKYLPDFLERDIYRNLIRLIIGNLSEIIRSVRLTILNHVITLHIEPVQPIQQQQPVEPAEEKTDLTVDGK